MKQSQSQESTFKKRKMSSDGLAPPDEMHILQRSPSPDSVLAHWSRGVRGVVSNLGGGGEPNEVINGATPEPSHFFSSAFSVISSQFSRLPENVGLALSVARTKLLRSGVVDDKHYDVSVKSFCRGSCQRSCGFSHLLELLMLTESSLKQSSRQPRHYHQTRSYSRIWLASSLSHFGTI